MVAEAPDGRADLLRLPPQPAPCGRRIVAERHAWAGAIRSATDARDVLAAVNRRGLERATTTALAEAVRPADDTELAPDASKLLPVDERLAGLLN
jgi:hypothetical protein